MTENSQDNEKVAVNVELGKEIDRSLGDIVSHLLSPSAKELGSLAGDYIGIFADRMRHKRQANLQAALDKTRGRLDAADVEMKDITPPEEEDIHLVLEGMSLSGDETVRELWAGLFAKALDPESGITIERPFVEVLKNLTTTDAKIVDFLAFTMNANADMQRLQEGFAPKDFRNTSDDEKERLDEANRFYYSLQQEAIAAIESRAKLHGIDELSGGAWSLNLLRLGLVVKSSTRSLPTLPSVPGRGADPRQWKQMIDNVAKQMIQNEADTLASPDRVIAQSPAGSQICLEVKLSAFGEHFAEACGLFSNY
ncbi:Abi-alpha family protein [uncultured Tateyamaria sp.]|uniref:Abi-alpha family protein n=1 Tax=uncultured Tateyamaria sp. TaxID=455651 RepID=UPI00260F7777|nr:Abi-alpha family protein [uncultured Tateyamaria sp.]